MNETQNTKTNEQMLRLPESSFAPVAVEIFEAALDEMNQRAVEGAPDLTRLFLKPAYKAAVQATLLEVDTENQVETPGVEKITMLCGGILQELKGAGVLDKADSIVIASDPETDAPALFYFREGKVPAVIDPVKHIGDISGKEEKYGRYVTSEGISLADAGAIEVPEPIESDEKKPLLTPVANDPTWSVDELFRYGTVHGDRGVTVQELVDKGLEPAFSVEVDDSTKIDFSMTYDYKGRKCAVGYIRKHDQYGRVESIVARTFYQSNSQGIWRYLPKHVDEGWFHKGHGESSLNLPARAQVAISMVAEMGSINVEKPDEVFFGTARNGYALDGITYVLEVDQEPNQLYGEWAKTKYDSKGRPILPSPESLDFDEYDQNAPDFTVEPEYLWQADTHLEQGVTFESVASKNGRFSYVFARTATKEAWLAFVEAADSSVTSLGVRGEWVDSGALETPVIEYHQQANGYGVYDGRISGQYVNMWPNYLRRSPLLQKYLASR